MIHYIEMIYYSIKCDDYILNKAMTDSHQSEPRDRPAIEITPAMVDAGVSALCRWADRSGVDDLPAFELLVRSILESSLRQPR